MVSAQGFAGAVIATAALAHAETHGQTYKAPAYAGAVHKGHAIVGASVDLTVPDCLAGLPYDYYSEYTADGWVGIDGFGPASSGLLQTGITCNAYYNGTVYYEAWYEYYPQAPYYFESRDIRPGDVLHMEVFANSTTSGTTSIHNTRSGETFAHWFSNLSPPMQFGDAEWITEAELALTPLGPEGRLSATYTPWKYNNMKYLTKDGKEHLFKYDCGGDHLIDTIINKTQIATAAYLGDGRMQVKDTTPCDFYVAGLYAPPRESDQPKPNCPKNN